MMVERSGKLGKGAATVEVMTISPPAEPVITFLKGPASTQAIPHFNTSNACWSHSNFSVTTDMELHTNHAPSILPAWF
jgi:hypothetical protein